MEVEVVLVPQRGVVRPGDLVGWLIFAWGVGGVVLVLVQAVVRLAPMAATLLDDPLTPLQGVAAVVWAGFMLYTEAWRGFHLRFSPRVVVRALGIAEDRRVWLVLLAPLVTMGLIYATRRRLIATHLLVIGIVAIVVAVGTLGAPWRAIIDLGVVLGLTAGTLSLLVHTWRAITGAPPSIAPDFPE